MDILIEVLLDIYMELMFLIIPEEKRTKKHVFLAKLTAIVATLGILVLGVWGLVWILQEGKRLGWIPLGIAIVLSTIQIAFGIIITIRRNRK